jgi:hypothetical protein
MGETTSEAPKKSRRRWAAFSVRGLLLLVLLVALWLGWAVHKAREQRAAVQAVGKFGGFVRYDWEFVVGPVNVPPGNLLWKPTWGKLTPGRRPPAPGWLRRALGDEYFQDIAHVSLFVDIENSVADATKYNIGPADDALAKLSTQNRVRTLHVGGQQVTDKNLAYVGRMTSLEELIVFPGIDISEVGVAHLAGLKNLRILTLTNTMLTDEGLRHLAGLTNLEELWVEGPSFSDAGLAHFRGMTRLKTLTMIANRNTITSEGRKRLQAAIPGLTLQIQ